MTPNDYSRPELRTLKDSTARDSGPAELSLAPVLDMQMAVSMEVGRARMTIRRLLGLTAGSVIELDRAASEAFSIYANGRLIAQGDVVVMNERLGARFTDVVTEAQRARAIE